VAEPSGPVSVPVQGSVVPPVAVMYGLSELVSTDRLVVVRSLLASYAPASPEASKADCPYTASSRKASSNAAL
jgi:hypothetical protein